MRRRIASLLVIWAAAGCTVDGNATGPAAAPPAAETPVAVAPRITPAPVGPPVRILWGPMQAQTLPIAVRVEPAKVAAARGPALVPANPEQLRQIEGAFAHHFAGSLGFLATLQSLRDQRYGGSEAWTFATTFAPGPFADQARALITTRRENEIRTFRPGSATLENAWVRPSNGAFGDAASIGLVEGTITFIDEVRTGAGSTDESHAWRIRATSQGQFFILDGAEAPDRLAPLGPFDPAVLDTELASQVAAHLHDEEAGPQAMPMSRYKGTAYWDARKDALDWLQALAVRGSLTDRHFEGLRAQITAFMPTSYLGDGYVTVHLRGTLIEVIDGVRRAYPVDERVLFERFSFAQPSWTAVDGQNDDGTWIARGRYGTPEPVAHG